MTSTGPAGGTTSVGPEAVVVLDIDDTLYLERDYVRSGFVAVDREVARSSGHHGLAEILWAGFESGIRGDSFNRALAVAGIEPAPESVARLVACYREHEPTIDLLADAGRFLDRLGTHRTAAITDGPAASQRAKARALGLDGRIHLLVVTAELGPNRGKPAPDAYLQVESHFGVGPESCWYIADNPAKDFLVPLQRGWHTVRVRRPGSLHLHLDSPPGVPEITSLDELVVENP